MNMNVCKRVCKRLFIIWLIGVSILNFPINVAAAEDYADGDVEQVFVWVREGDATFCYVNNGGWNEADMLVGWHTIDGNTYYFYEEEMMDARYGQMATGEVWLGAWTFIFNSEGHLVELPLFFFFYFRFKIKFGEGRVFVFKLLLEREMWRPNPFAILKKFFS